MGGKDKKGPRTKGNMKPSSSGRSAELLGHAPTFVGFSGLAETQYTLSVVSHFPTEESELTIPSEFRLILKKMSKKDTTTKIKALQEFKDHCEIAPIEVLKSVLPFWPRIFTRLAIDADRRVRENVQKSHSSFVTKLGRNLAPSLKEIMGAWFTSQCDIHAPAASIASHSLSSCFPDAKLLDALLFCHGEIMDYILDSLLKDEDYSEEQKERIIVGGLAGYSLLLQEIDITKILNNEVNANRHINFWESDKELYSLVSKESGAIIKNTWFSTIHNFLYFLPQLAQGCATKFISSVFSFLDDKESISMPSLWETVLKLLVTVNKPSLFPDFQTHVVPRILNLLENGFYGNAYRIGPLILPIVKILRENSQCKERLDRQIVEAFCLGISHTCVSCSAMEVSAISTSLFQCLDHMVKINQSDSIINDLFEALIIPYIDRLVKSSCSDLVLVAVVRQMALSLDNWFFNDIPSSFGIWSQLENLMESVLSQTTHPDKNATAQRIGLICSTFIDPDVKVNCNLRKPSARPVRVRFNDPNNQDNLDVPTDASLPVVAPRVNSERFQDKVVELSVRICHNALECEESNGCHTCLNLLVLLMYHDRVSQAFLALVATSPIEMISLHIKPMLRKTPGRDTASLLFTFIDAVQPDRRKGLLEDLTQDEEICLTLVTTALENFSHKNSVVEWLSGSQIAVLLKSVAKQLVTFRGMEKTPSLWNLLRASLLSRKSQENVLVLPDKHLNEILNVFAEYLGVAEIPPGDSLDQFIQSLGKIWKSTNEIHRLKAAAQWRDAIITFLCSTHRLEPDSVSCLLEMWCRSASVAIKLSCMSAISIIKVKVLQEDMAENLLDRIICVFNHLVSLWVNDYPEEVFTLIEQAVPTSSEWTAILHESDAPNLMAKEILNGNYVQTIPITIVGFRPVQVKNWSALVKIAFFVSSVAVQCHFPANKLPELFSHLLYSMVAGQLLCDLTNKRHKDTNMLYIARLNNSLEKNLETIISNCSAHVKLLVIREIEALCGQRPWIWTFVIKKLAQWRCTRNSESSAVKQMTGKDSHSEQDERNEGESLPTQLAKLNSSNLESWGDSRQLLATIRLSLQHNDPALCSFDTIDTLIQLAQMWQKEYNEQFLFSTNLKTIEGTETAWAVVEIVRLLAVAVEFHAQHLTPLSWDFILCSMSSWCSSLSESWDLDDMSTIKATVNFSTQNSSPLLLSFSIALCQLVKNCASIIAQVDHNPPNAETTFLLPPNLKSEWSNVFSEVAYGVIEQLFLRLLKKNRTKVPNEVFDFLAEAVSSSLYHIPLQLIKSPIGHLSPHLLAKQPSIQFATYAIVKKLLPGIASIEESDLKEDDDEKNMERRPNQALLSVLEKVSLPSVEGIRIGDLHTVEPYSSECYQFLGFCLTWDLILSLCGHSSSVLRYQYAAYLTKTGLMTELMDKLFCIIPHATRQQPVELDFVFHSDGTVTEGIIQDLAVKVYSSASRYLPAVVRRWCNSTDKRTASLVEKFTSRCVSPALCASDLQFSTKTWDNMTVRVRASAREVVATYKLNEEGSMELVIQLPTNYPLGNITVETGRKVGVTSSQWRNWMLQLTTFLMHQNGSILDGLILWKRNVDKRFEGVEECYICYYVLHGTNYQLPKLQCRTCRKKFHADCLYKWFSTSNNSTCPLCRNLF